MNGLVSAWLGKLMGLLGGMMPQKERGEEWLVLWESRDLANEYPNTLAEAFGTGGGVFLRTTGVVSGDAPSPEEIENDPHVLVLVGPIEETFSLLTLEDEWRRFVHGQNSSIHQALFWDSDGGRIDVFSPCSEAPPRRQRVHRAFRAVLDEHISWVCNQSEEQPQDCPRSPGPA